MSAKVTTFFKQARHLSEPGPKKPRLNINENLAGEIALTWTPLNEGLYKRSRNEYSEGDDDIVFQLIECEDASKDKDAEAGLNTLMFAGERDIVESPSIRLFGCTVQGESICVLVKGCWPYFYFPVTPNFTGNDIPTFLTNLRTHIADTTTKNSLIRSATLVIRKPLMYHRPGNPLDKYSHFLRIVVSSPSDMSRLHKALCTADEIPGLSELFQQNKLYDAQPYESNLSFDLRVMVELSLVGAGWVKIRGRSSGAALGWKFMDSIAEKGRRGDHIYTCCSLNIICCSEEIFGLTKEGHTLVEDEADTSDVKKKVESSGEGEDYAPLRVMCLMVTSLITERDMNSEGEGGPMSISKKKGREKGKSGTKQNISMQQQAFIGFISVILTNRSTLAKAAGQKDCDKTILLTHSFANTKLSCTAESAKIYVYETEKEMVLAFCKLLIEYDPDVLTGYDVTDHIVLLLKRIRELSLPSFCSKLSRLPHLETKARSRQTYSANWVRSQRRMAATSNREFLELNMTGRWVIDMRHVMEREERLRTYTFADAVTEVLKIRKEVLDREILSKMWFSDAQGERTRISDYLRKDIEIALQLMQTTVALVNYAEMARVTGLNFDDCLNRGQMARIWSLLFRFCRSLGVVVPALRERNESGMTEGPINWMPESGFNTTSPIAVLDFRSLYPSIIIAHNLCFSTLLLPEHREHFPNGENVDYESGLGPQECYFVKNHIKKGILPRILEHLLSERQKVKTRMQQTTDPVMKIVLNGRQLALKVCANSAYGFTGAKDSKLQSLPIAETTIVRAGRMLERARDEIHVQFGSRGCRVVYGDTDSVFVRFADGTSVNDAIQMGKEISEKVSKVWIDPIKLQFEKVLFPSILANRKRYAGMMWTKPNGSDGMDVKGIESQRRDTIPLLNKLMSNMLEILLPMNCRNTSDSRISSDERVLLIDQVINLVKNVVHECLRGRIDVGEFVLTKGLWLGTETEDYKSKQAHVELVERFRKRDGGRKEFHDGERISYVFVQAPVGSKGFEKSEDPRYAMEMGLSLDYLYYLRHQLEAPLTRILELIVPPPQITDIFYGDHTRTKAITSIPISGKGSLDSFFTRSAGSCLICRRKISKNETLCEEHTDMVSDIHISLQKHIGDLGQRNTDLYAICRQCQGSIARDVICVNTDCSIYYRRCKIASDSIRADAEMEGFLKSLDW